MCEKEEIDLEEFVRKNKEKIEKILKEDHGTLREKIEPQKEKIEGALKGIMSLLLDPKVQIHFVKAGMELLSGVEELIKKAPLPEDMKENVGKACEMKDKMVNNIMNEMDQRSKSKEDKMKKIDVE